MIKTIEDLKYYLKEDKRALGYSQRKLPKFLGDEIWKFQIVLRKLDYYTNCQQNLITKIAKYYYKYIHHQKGIKLGFSIPINVFGPGLRINHYGYIVVNKHAKIGGYCDIHQGVNIGQNIHYGDVPTIGDNVWIGPGVKIFGKIDIADNIVIGANSVVTKSFNEKNITIVGSPARKLKNNKGTTKI
ncbi:serine acetyltransferase [Neobacillus drentensis]|uniref:serine acetyltransferase n=1 Tax=Neobacillus drentensis TaxID=220684 RepID=UPI0030027344